MLDSKNVMKGLEWVINDIEENGNINHAGQYLDAIKDALELLNEQQEKIDGLNALLSLAHAAITHHGKKGKGCQE